MAAPRKKLPARRVDVSCDSCGAKLFKYAKGNGAGSKLVKVYEERIVKDRTADQVTCPNPACGVAIEKVPPRRNPDGDLELVAERIPGTARWMSREALEHKAAKLFRCGACGTDFCGDCDAMPYHVGFASCAAAAAAAKAPRCRYCRERITPGASALDFYYFGGGGGDEDGRADTPPRQ